MRCQMLQISFRVNWCLKAKQLCRSDFVNCVSCIIIWTLKLFSLANLLKSHGRHSILVLSTNSSCLAMISNGTIFLLWVQVHDSLFWTKVAVAPKESWVDTLLEKLQKLKSDGDWEWSMQQALWFQLVRDFNYFGLTF